MKTSADTFSNSLDEQAFWPSALRLLLVFAILVLAGCGRAGDPIPPPSHSLESTQLLEVFQRGDRLMVRWPRPNLNNPRSTGVSRVDIYRLQEPTTASRPMREEIFLEEAQLIGFLTSEQIKQTETPFLTFEDQLDPQDTSWKNQRYRYAVRYTDLRNQLAPLSNFALITPASNLIGTPTDLMATVSQDVITLTWKAPATTLDHSPLPASPTYNIYRRGSKSEFGKRPLNATPLTEPRFADTKFKFKNDYVYVVRSVTEVRGEMVESLDSETVTVAPIDTFAPATPQNVTGASATGVVSLFWPSNAEPDLKGYVVYRAEKSDHPKWGRLTPGTITTTTYRDTTGEKGKTYLYQISAVDVFDNESPHSEAVSVEVVN